MSTASSQSQIGYVQLESAYGTVPNGTGTATVANGDAFRLIKLVKVYPLKMKKILTLIGQPKLVYILEEGIRSGGIGEKLAAGFAQNDAFKPGKVRIHAIENPLMEQGDLAALYHCCGFLPQQIADEVSEMLG